METVINDSVQVRRLQDDWERLSAKYLPVGHPNSLWRYSRPADSLDLDQGWKLHISATILNATDVLLRISPFLQAHSVRFKAPLSLGELHRLNCGLFYGYSQVCKFITVYPRSTEEALFLARNLEELTKGIAAPSVPFDLRYRPGSCVYYRYGSFKHLEVQNSDGSTTAALRTPDGKLVPDERESEIGYPSWVKDPFIKNDNDGFVAGEESLLGTTFRAFQALSQRGKGGVYKAFDLSTSPARICLLKEGRAHGELGWNGRRNPRTACLRCFRGGWQLLPCV